MANYRGIKVKFTGTVSDGFSTRTTTEDDFNTGEFSVASNIVTVDGAGYYNIHGVWGPLVEYTNNQGVRIRRRPDGGSWGELFALDNSSANGPGADMHFDFSMPLIWLDANDDIDFQFSSQTTSSFATDHGYSWAVIELAVGVSGAKTVTPGLLSAAPTLHQPTVTTTITRAIGLLDASPALHEPTVVPSATIETGLLNAAPTIWEPTVVPQGSLIEASWIAPTTLFHEPTLATTVDVTIDTVINAAPTMHEPTLAPGDVAITFAAALDASPTIEEPVVQADTFTILPESVDAAPTLHEPTLDTTATVSIGAAINAAPTMHEPTLDQFNQIAPDVLNVVQFMHEPTVAPQATTRVIDQTVNAAPTLHEPTLATTVTRVIDQTINAAPVIHEPSFYIYETILVDFLNSSTIIHDLTLTTSDPGTTSVGFIPI